MKKLQLNVKWIAWACGIVLLSNACSQDSGKTETTGTEKTEDHSGMEMTAGSSTKMMDLMHENMAAMQKMEMTGDVDHDFAMMMATHHEGALSMAQEQADNGQDSMLVNMAKKTLSTQKEEKDKLKQFADSHKPVPGDKAASMKLMSSMESSMAGMDHSKGGNTDQHFATLMGLHHQSGIDMSKAYLSSAKVPELKVMAQKIIDDQQREKQQLDAWLQSNKQ